MHCHTPPHLFHSIIPQGRSDSCSFTCHKTRRHRCNSFIVKDILLLACFPLNAAPPSHLLATCHTLSRPLPSLAEPSASSTRSCSKRTEKLTIFLQPITYYLHINQLIPLTPTRKFSTIPDILVNAPLPLFHNRHHPPQKLLSKPPRLHWNDYETHLL